MVRIKKNSYPVKLSSLTDRQKQPQSRSFMLNIFPFWCLVLFLVPSHAPMSLASTPHSLLKFPGLFQHRNTRARIRGLQGSGGQRLWNAREDVEARSLSNLLKVIQAEIPSPVPFDCIFYCLICSSNITLPSKNVWLSQPS